MFNEILQRLKQLDTLIQKGNTGSPNELATRLNLSERSVFEYLNLMRSLKAPIKFSPQRNTYYYEREGEFIISFLSNKNSKQHKERSGKSVLQLKITKPTIKKELSGNDLAKVQDAATLLTQNLNKHITIPELSIMVNLPEKKLKAGFMQLYGTGAYKHLTDARLKKVKEMLFQGLPLKGIAMETGYKDKGSLIKAFRIKFGITPAKWKNQHANGNNNDDAD